MIFKKFAYKKTAILLSIISVMSMSLISCGSSTDTSNNKDTSVSESSDDSSSENVVKNYTQDELSEDEKVKVYLFSSDKYYHIDKNCEGIKKTDDEKQPSSVDEAADDDDKYMTLVKKAAENCGYLPCPKCAGGTEVDDSSK